jgi:NAD(P)H-hydrate epimerase
LLAPLLNKTKCSWDKHPCDTKADRAFKMTNEKMILSRDEVRRLDRLAIEKIGIPGIVLMENAGRGIVDYLLSLKVRDSIVICCGKGNNAGDGFVIARYLDNVGYPIKILLFSDPNELKGDAKLNYDIVLNSSLPITIMKEDRLNIIGHDILSKADWIIDALFGTGLSDHVRSPYDQVIKAINESGTQVLSVDVPSGLDCDTGEPLGIAVKAQYTATLVCYKKGFIQEKAKPYLGKVHVINIGIPRNLIHQFKTSPKV